MAIMPVTRQPDNTVLVNGVPLWYNRPIELWHGPFFNEPTSKCPNLDCPYGEHASEGTCYDPNAMRAFNELLVPGTRVLMLIDCAERQHVSLVTVRQTEIRGWPRFCIEEPSANLYFFRPGKRHHTRIGLDVNWYTVRWVALVDPEHQELPFGKYGGLECFKRELSYFAVATMAQVNAAIDQLSRMNPMPIRLKPASPWAEYMDDLVRAGNYDELRPLITNTLGIRTEPTTTELVFAYTQRGDWPVLLPAFADWTPPNPESFGQRLVQRLNWYTSRVPSDLDKIHGWWELWDRQFRLGPMPTISPPGGG